MELLYSGKGKERHAPLKNNVLILCRDLLVDIATSKINEIHGGYVLSNEHYFQHINDYDTSRKCKRKFKGESEGFRENKINGMYSAGSNDFYDGDAISEVEAGDSTKEKQKPKVSEDTIRTTAGGLEAKERQKQEFCLEENVSQLRPSTTDEHSSLITKSSVSCDVQAGSLGSEKRHSIEKRRQQQQERRMNENNDEETHSECTNRSTLTIWNNSSYWGLFVRTFLPSVLSLLCNGLCTIQRQKTRFDRVTRSRTSSSCKPIGHRKTRRKKQKIRDNKRVPPPQPLVSAHGGCDGGEKDDNEEDAETERGPTKPLPNERPKDRLGTFINQDSGANSGQSVREKNEQHYHRQPYDRSMDPVQPAPFHDDDESSNSLSVTQLPSGGTEVKGGECQSAPSLTTFTAATDKSCPTEPSPSHHCHSSTERSLKAMTSPGTHMMVAGSCGGRDGDKDDDEDKKKMERYDELIERMKGDGESEGKGQEITSQNNERRATKPPSHEHPHQESVTFVHVSADTQSAPSLPTSFVSTEESLTEPSHNQCYPPSSCGGSGGDKADNKDKKKRQRNDHLLQRGKCDGKTENTDQEDTSEKNTITVTSTTNPLSQEPITTSSHVKPDVSDDVFSTQPQITRIVHEIECEVPKERVETFDDKVSVDSEIGLDHSTRDESEEQFSQTQELQTESMQQFKTPVHPLDYQTLPHLSNPCPVDTAAVDSVSTKALPHLSDSCPRDTAAVDSVSTKALPHLSNPCPVDTAAVDSVSTKVLPHLSDSCPRDTAAVDTVSMKGVPSRITSPVPTKEYCPTEPFLSSLLSSPSGHSSKLATSPTPVTVVTSSGGRGSDKDDDEGIKKRERNDRPLERRKGDGERDDNDQEITSEKNAISESRPTKLPSHEHPNRGLATFVNQGSCGESGSDKIDKMDKKKREKNDQPPQRGKCVGKRENKDLKVTSEKNTITATSPTKPPSQEPMQTLSNIKTVSDDVFSTQPQITQMGHENMTTEFEIPTGSSGTSDAEKSIDSELGPDQSTQEESEEQFQQTQTESMQRIRTPVQCTCKPCNDQTLLPHPNNPHSAPSMDTKVLNCVGMKCVSTHVPSLTTSTVVDDKSCPTKPSSSNHLSAPSEHSSKVTTLSDNPGPVTVVTSSGGSVGNNSEDKKRERHDLSLERRKGDGKSEGKDEDITSEKERDPTIPPSHDHPKKSPVTSDNQDCEADLCQSKNEHHCQQLHEREVQDCKTKIHRKLLHRDDKVVLSQPDNPHHVSHLPSGGTEVIDHTHVEYQSAPSLRTEDQEREGNDKENTSDNIMVESVTVPVVASCGGSGGDKDNNEDKKKKDRIRRNRKKRTNRNNRPLERRNDGGEDHSRRVVAIDRGVTTFKASSRQIQIPPSLPTGDRVSSTQRHGCRTDHILSSKGKHVLSHLPDITRYPYRIARPYQSRKTVRKKHKKKLLRLAPALSFQTSSGTGCIPPGASSDENMKPKLNTQKRHRKTKSTRAGGSICKPTCKNSHNEISMDNEICPDQSMKETSEKQFQQTHEVGIEATVKLTSLDCNGHQTFPHCNSPHRDSTALSMCAEVMNSVCMEGLQVQTVVDSCGGSGDKKDDNEDKTEDSDDQSPGTRNEDQDGKDKDASESNTVSESVTVVGSCDGSGGDKDDDEERKKRDRIGKNRKKNRKKRKKRDGKKNRKRSNRLLHRRNNRSKDHSRRVIAIDSGVTSISFSKTSPRSDQMLPSMPNDDEVSSTQRHGCRTDHILSSKGKHVLSHLPDITRYPYHIARPCRDRKTVRKKHEKKSLRLAPALSFQTSSREDRLPSGASSSGIIKPKSSTWKRYRKKSNKAGVNVCEAMNCVCAEGLRMQTVVGSCGGSGGEKGDNEDKKREDRDDQPPETRNDDQDGKDKDASESNTGSESVAVVGSCGGSGGDKDDDDDEERKKRDRQREHNQSLERINHEDVEGEDDSNKSVSIDSITSSSVTSATQTQSSQSLPTSDGVSFTQQQDDDDGILSRQVLSHPPDVTCYPCHMAQSYRDKKTVRKKRRKKPLSLDIPPSQTSSGAEHMPFSASSNKNTKLRSSTWKRQRKKSNRANAPTISGIAASSHPLPPERLESQHLHSYDSVAKPKVKMRRYFSTVVSCQRNRTQEVSCTVQSAAADISWQQNVRKLQSNSIIAWKKHKKLRSNSIIAWKKRKKLRSNAIIAWRKRKKKMSKRVSVLPKPQSTDICRALSAQFGMANSLNTSFQEGLKSHCYYGSVEKIMKYYSLVYHIEGQDAVHTATANISWVLKPSKPQANATSAWKRHKKKTSKKAIDNVLPQPATDSTLPISSTPFSPEWLESQQSLRYNDGVGKVKKKSKGEQESTKTLLTTQSSASQCSKRILKMSRRRGFPVMCMSRFLSDGKGVDSMVLSMPHIHSLLSGKSVHVSQPNAVSAWKRRRKKASAVSLGQLNNCTDQWFSSIKDTSAEVHVVASQYCKENHTDNYSHLYCTLSDRRKKIKLSAGKSKLQALNLLPQPQTLDSPIALPDNRAQCLFRGDRPPKNLGPKIRKVHVLSQSTQMIPFSNPCGQVIPSDTVESEYSEALPESTLNEPSTGAPDSGYVQTSNTISSDCKSPTNVNLNVDGAAQGLSQRQSSIPKPLQNVSLAHEEPVRIQAPTSAPGAVCLHEQVVENNVSLSPQHTNPPVTVPSACDEACGYTSETSDDENNENTKFVSLQYLSHVPQTFYTLVQPGEEEVRVDESTHIIPLAENSVAQVTTETCEATCETTVSSCTLQQLVVGNGIFQPSSLHVNPPLTAYSEQAEYIDPAYEVPIQATADVPGAVCETAEPNNTLQEQVVSNDVFQLSLQHANTLPCDELRGYTSEDKSDDVSLPCLAHVSQNFIAQVQPEEEEVRADESTWAPPQSEHTDPAYELPVQATANTSGAVQKYAVRNDFFQQHTSPPVTVTSACDKPLCDNGSKTSKENVLYLSLPYLAHVPRTFFTQVQPGEEEVKVDESTWTPPRAKNSAITYEVSVQATADTSGAVCETGDSGLPDMHTLVLIRNGVFELLPHSTHLPQTYIAQVQTPEEEVRLDVSTSSLVV